VSERYEIVVSGADGPLVRAAFDELEVQPLGDGRLLLAGELADQAALHGVLHRMQGLGLVIVELHQTTDP